MSTVSPTARAPSALTHSPVAIAEPVNARMLTTTLADDGSLLTVTPDGSTPLTVAVLFTTLAAASAAVI